MHVKTAINYLTALSSKREEIINAGENVKKENSPAQLVEMWVGADTMENSSKVLQKVKTRTTSISIFGNISEEIENTMS